MALSKTLTIEERAALRAELVELEERILMKIRHITYTHQKLPFGRLAKGRALKETVLQTIEYLDKGNDQQLGIFLARIETLGIKLKNI